MSDVTIDQLGPVALVDRVRTSRTAPIQLRKQEVVGSSPIVSTGSGPLRDSGGGHLACVSATEHEGDLDAIHDHQRRRHG